MENSRFFAYPTNGANLCYFPARPNFGFQAPTSHSPHVTFFVIIFFNLHVVLAERGGTEILRYSNLGTNITTVFSYYYKTL